MPKDEGASRPKAVLVVDDDSNIRMLLSVSLRREGYTIHEARNGREALEQMSSGTDDLVLLDLMMPEVSGWDVLAKRSQSEPLRRIPVIVISASRGVEIAGGAGANICALVPKPFDLDMLIATVRICLEHEHLNGAPHKVA